MPTLHNQSKSALSFDMGGKHYTCEPWGPVDVPDKFVPIVKQYGLPLGPVPVAPENRAQQRVVDEQESAKNDVLKALKAEADRAKAESRAATEELGRVQIELQDARSKARALGDELAAVKRDLRSALADKKAAEDLLGETARAATVSEEKALKAEALLTETKVQKSKR